MKVITAEDYFELVMKGFSHLEPAENDEVTILSEDIFKFRWMARLRLCSFITHADGLDAHVMRYYTLRCIEMAKKNRSKLGEPLVCFAVAMSDSISRDAIDFSLQRPQIHPAMNVYPVLVDLKNGEIHYYTGPILYGVIYASFEREYMNGHFALPLRILKEGLS